MMLTAKEIIRKAIDAHGGDVWKHPKTLQLYGNAIMYFKNGSEHILDTYSMQRVFPVTNTEARTANGKVALLAKSKDKVFFDLRFNGTQSHSFLSETAKRLQDHFIWSNNFGFGIIRFALDRKLECSHTDSYNFGVVPCYYVIIKDTSGKDTVFGIHKNDFRIVYMGFNTPLGFHIRAYSNFKQHPQVSFLMPLSLSIYYDDFRWLDVRWRDFHLNIPIENKVFEIN